MLRKFGHLKESRRILQNTLKGVINIINKIKLAIEKLDALSKTKPIKIISHFDTDGITSAAIFSRALQRWNKKFSLQIIKGLDEKIIKSLPEDEILVFLDLASNSLRHLKEKKTDIFIFDHHEVIESIPENITLINPLLQKNEPMSSAAICYFFAKSLSLENKDLANLAIVGMVGDMLEKNLTKDYDAILKDADAIIRKGLLLYPSTRPLDKALEYSSGMYIPEVTGSYKGVMDILREANIHKIENRFKALYELTEEEMSRLITAVMLRIIGRKDSSELIGNLYLVKFFNKLEDAREFSALINSCSRMDRPEIALGFCLGNKKCIEEAEKIYIQYKQHLISALKYVSESEKISGKNYTIINGKDRIKDTIIGTVASIISHSPVYANGTIIIALAYNQDKIKVSARIVGREGRNVREVLNQVVVPLGGEVGGHPKAAGCLISKENESKFIYELRKVLDIESIKV
ncbi:DHH family phosphoesterase [Candidatus Pacearchaeota archaeon]|nr:DHH family phosphoesterase [Candidatus Pacearchaeota archaeon]